MIRKLKEQEDRYGWDGINDASTYWQRYGVGIAVGAGADVAIDAADVVLMKSSLA